MAKFTQVSLKTRKPFMIQTLLQHPVRTSLAAGIAVFVAVAAYGIFKPSQWEATQPLVIRAEALEGSNLPGRFDSDQQRRQLLDTLVAVLQTRDVLETALREVGPGEVVRNRPFPRATDVERLQRSVRVVPPSDTDFGTTDLIYLKVRDSQPERAIRLAQALVKQADRQLREILLAKAQATLEELTQAEQNAMDGVQTLTRQLQAIETQLGLDGLTLRSYEEKLDDTSLRAPIDDLEDQLAQLESEILTKNELIRLLGETTTNPGTLSSIPSTLIENYPTLSHFQEALRQAEVKLIELRGQYADEHPAVIAAQLAFSDLTDRIRKEIPAVIRTIENEQRVKLAQKKLLDQRRQAEESRMAAIMAVLPQYRELTARLRSQSDAVRAAQQRLVVARAAVAAAQSAQLVTPIEPPRTGNQPVGPGKMTIVAGGMVSAVFLAFCVFLWISPTVSDGERQDLSSAEHVLSKPTAAPPSPVNERKGAPDTTTAPAPCIETIPSVPPVDLVHAEYEPTLVQTSQEQQEQSTRHNLADDNPCRSNPPVSRPGIPISPDWAESPLHQALLSPPQAWQ